jgi:hypothetical protein
MQRHEYGQKWNHVWGGGEVRRWFPSEMVTQSPEGGDLSTTLLLRYNGSQGPIPFASTAHFHFSEIIDSRGVRSAFARRVKRKH